MRTRTALKRNDTSATMDVDVAAPTFSDIEEAVPPEPPQSPGTKLEASAAAVPILQAYAGRHYFGGGDPKTVRAEIPVWSAAWGRGLNPIKLAIKQSGAVEIKHNSAKKDAFMEYMHRMQVDDKRRELIRPLQIYVRGDPRDNAQLCNINGWYVATAEFKGIETEVIAGIVDEYTRNKPFVHMRDPSAQCLASRLDEMGLDVLQGNMTIKYLLMTLLERCTEPVYTVLPQLLASYTLVLRDFKNIYKSSDANYKDPKAIMLNSSKQKELRQRIVYGGLYGVFK